MQTWESLRTNTIEEVYELTQALADEEPEEVRKELGDVFLHVAFYALIAEERGRFGLKDVISALCDKLVFRHPHVFGDPNGEKCEKMGTADEVLKTWEKIKLKEKDGNKTVLGGVPRELPAMIKAYRIQGKVKGVGFDWPDAAGAWDKLREEEAEFKAETVNGDKDKMEEEMGDLLFSVINLARTYNINPENALERTNRKFTSRFNYIERKAKENGRQLTEMTLEEMDELWEEAKKK